MDGLLGFLMIAIPVFFIIRKFVKKTQMKEQFAKLPKEGPMKVNISEEDYPAGSFGSKRFKCNLRFDI
jgi:hypothetical protein